MEKILSPAESDGKVALLAGGGQCPREDGQNVRCWEECVRDLTIDKHKEIAQSLNYQDDLEVRRLGSRWRFDPAAFDIQVARKRISDALASPASVPSGPKKQHFGPGTPEQMMGHSHVPKGTHQVITPSDPFGKNSRLFRAFTSETVRDKRDKRVSALCGHCGQPIQAPKMCSACKNVYYCNVEQVDFCFLRCVLRANAVCFRCQKDHWKEHKQLCASNKKQG